MIPALVCWLFGHKWREEPFPSFFPELRTPGAPYIPIGHALVSGLRYFECARCRPRRPGDLGIVP